MIDYTVYADHPAVRLLRFSFLFVTTLWLVVMYMPSPSWVLTFAGMIVMCNPVLWAELVIDRGWPSLVARWTHLMRRMPSLSLRPGASAAVRRSLRELIPGGMRSFR